MERDLVSVIMPTYNNTRHLAESIESVLGQTYSNLELIITDDHSTNPDVVSTIKAYAKRDSRVKPFFLEKNQGPGVARNNCIKEANGRYIAFCDCDDRWYSCKLQKQIEFMQEKDCTLCYCSYLECDENNDICGIVVAPDHITLNDLKRDNKIGCLTAIYDTSKFGKFYMPTIRKRQDWALFLTIMKECKDAYALTEPLAYYRISKNSVSRNKLSLIKYNVQVYKEVFGYNTIIANAYFYFIFMPTYTYKCLSNKIKFSYYIKEYHNRHNQ